MLPEDYIELKKRLYLLIQEVREAKKEIIVQTIGGCYPEIEVTFSGKEDMTNLDVGIILHGLDTAQATYLGNKINKQLLLFDAQAKEEVKKCTTTNHS